MNALRAGWLVEAAGWSLLFAWLLHAGWQASPDPRLSALIVAAWLLMRRGAQILLKRRSPPVPRMIRLGFVLGAIAATPMLLFAPILAPIAGLAAIVVGLAGAGRAEPADGQAGHGGAPPGRAIEEPAAAAPSGAPSGTTDFRPLVQPRTLSYLAAAFATGMLLAGLYSWLPQLVVAAGLDVALVGVALALVGAGSLVALPVVRLRSRLPAVLPLVALLGATAVTVAAAVLLGPWLVGFALLVPVGILLVTLDAEQLIAARRASSGAKARLTRLLASFGIGHLAGALAVGLLGSEPAAVGGPVVVLAGVGAAISLAVLALDRRSLRAMRHQVQEFSWNADPPPRRFAEASLEGRSARLAGWIQREVELELVDVKLPVSGRNYAVARPSGDGRDSLFERAKADPERQMPYWAKVWPSGVALADVVVERAEEVRDGQVLELGAGLGVTAITVLEEGGRLVTADYSLLPLALCRFNGLLNAGRAPGSICFNWRDEEQVQGVLRRHPPIGLVLAADVLYEYRDIQPLIDVIEKLLAPGGSLWLAEPVRRTAQRFLDIVAASGWQIDSRRIRASWPDATDGWVNVHIIRRQQEPLESILALGGWQA